MQGRLPPPWRRTRGGTSTSPLQRPRRKRGPYPGTGRSRHGRRRGRARGGCRRRARIWTTEGSAPSPPHSGVRRLGSPLATPAGRRGTRCTARTPGWWSTAGSRFRSCTPTSSRRTPTSSRRRQRRRRGGSSSGWPQTGRQHQGGRRRLRTLPEFLKATSTMSGPTATSTTTSAMGAAPIPLSWPTSSTTTWTRLRRPLPQWSRTQRPGAKSTARGPRSQRLRRDRQPTSSGGGNSGDVRHRRRG